MIDVTDDTFDEELKTDLPVVVDFWATWCGPCKRLSPALELLQEKYKDKVKVIKVNVMENPELSMRYKVQGIPHLIVIKDGQVVDTMTGFAGQESLEQFFDGFIEKA